MLVYAFDQGRTTPAGLVAVAQLIPATVFAPYGGVLADRGSPARVLVAGYLVQAAAMAAVAISLLSGGPPLISYACAALAATAATVPRPAQAALVPRLAHHPDELTAFNVISGWIESVCILVAPALTGVVLGLSSPGTVFAICAGVALAAGLAVMALVPRTSGGTGGSESALRDTVAEVVAGLRPVGEARSTRLLMLLLATECWPSCSRSTCSASATPASAT
jgi:nitrate/nitrite transporter NarK